MSEAMITKRALGAAMKRLMSERPFDRITVGDVCELCGMSRKGFYYHFKDKYDLVNWIFHVEALERLRDKEYEDCWEPLADICCCLFESRAFYLAAFRAQGQNSFPEYFTEALRPVILEALRRSLPEGEVDAFCAGFIGDALCVSMVKWLGAEPTVSVGKYVSLLRQTAESIAAVSEWKKEE